VAGGTDAGVVLTPGAGVVAGLSSDRPIAKAIPTSSTATAVLMITIDGTRYQGITGSFFFFSGSGRWVWSQFSAGRADV
jgi:hypothetical protein